MRFLHISDSHLGFRQYSRIVPQGEEFAGLNQREVDAYLGFRWAIETAVKESVDAVVHSGDMFDTARPSNRALVEAISGIKRLDENGIEFFVVAGNHSTPRLRQTGSVFRVIEHLANAHTVFNGYGRTVIGETAFHGVPHTFDDATAFEWVRSLNRDDQARYNVAVLHCGITSIASHYLEISQMNIDDGALPYDFDYVALGHVHQHHVIRRNVVYSGSLERFSFAEADDAKGAVLVDLENEGWEFIERAGRRMQNLKLDCTRRAYSDIEEELTAIIEQAEEGSLLRIVLKDIMRSELRSLNIRDLRERGGGLLHLEIAHEASGDSISAPQGTSIGALSDEFSMFIEEAVVDASDRSALLKAGQEILMEVNPD